MPKKFNKQIYEVVGALDRAEVEVPEIHRRLNENEAGLEHAVEISRRTVYDYRAKFRREEPSGEIDQDQTAHSIAALKQRHIDRIAKELRYIESIPAGKLTSRQTTALHQQFIKLDDMERREQIAQKRRARPAKPNTNQNGNEDQDESPVERLARQARENSKQFTDEEAA